MKRLNQLQHWLNTHIEDLKALQLAPNSTAPSELTLANLHIDSRGLQANDVFIALQGATHHGLSFLPQACAAGVACVLSDRALSQSEQACLHDYSSGSNGRLVTVWVLPNLTKHLAALAKWFYDAPCSKLKVVGITGTNGKTSTAHYLAQLLWYLGQTPALIGTLGNGVVSNLSPLQLSQSNHTTPDVVAVFRLLHQFYQQGATWVVMEVSSHALALGRVEGVSFNCVALTQVTRDHLDFHGSEPAYQSAKASLFTDYKSQHQVLNANDALGQRLFTQLTLHQPSHAFLYGMPLSASPFSKKQRVSEKTVALQAQKVSLNANGVCMQLSYQAFPQLAVETEQACLHLMGAFNIENTLCALSVLLVNQFNWRECVSLLAKLTPVNGRMHQVFLPTTQTGFLNDVSSKVWPSVVVDFAHTPDALQQVLSALAPHAAKLSNQSAAIWLVFGCGGDRDRGKRPLMAQVAERYADHLVLTNDNPRFESPQQIFQDTLAGCEAPNRVHVIEDRKAAIEFALIQANPQDVILIAGKGHEPYQDVAGTKRPFSDQQVVLDWMRAHLPNTV